MNSLEQFEKDVAEKRAALEAQVALARLLPTNGKSITWTGENGWDSKGQPNPPIEKTCELLPWVVHGPTAYKAAKHVAYKAPDDYKWTNGKGEHVSSKYRAGFVRQYLLAVLDCFAPLVMDTVAVKGSRYKGHFPDGFDYRALRDYTDAEEFARGKCLVRVGSGVGEYGHTSGHLEVYTNVPELGPLRVDISDALQLYKLAPRAHGVRRYGQDGPVQSVDRWEVPTYPDGVQDVRVYGSGDSRRLSCDTVWLFDTVAHALAVVLPEVKAPQ